MLCISVSQFSFQVATAVPPSLVSHGVKEATFYPADLGTSFNDYNIASITNATMGGNTTRVSVITATPEVSTIIATAITTTISASTASISISTTGGQQDYYLEAAIVIIAAVILGALVFGRRKKTAASSQP
jgi:hypothetical protein